MDENLFNIDKFNIIQDDENYYFFRALNMADNNDIEQGITTSSDGTLERVRTDRERHGNGAKYSEDSQISLEELFDHIKMHYLKETNCISLASNANTSIYYGRGFYKDKYVMVKVPKSEFGKQTVLAGKYMLKELYSRIENAVQNLPDDQKTKILSIFEQIDNTNDSNGLKKIIQTRFTASSDELDVSKAHPRKGIIYSEPQARISNYQSLNKDQLLDLNRVYAKLAILENNHILDHAIPHTSNANLRRTIGSAFASTELIHYGDIKQEELIDIPKEAVDLFALIQQVDGINKDKAEELKRGLLEAVKSGKKIPEIQEADAKVKDDVSIEEMYELTGGKVEYEKASSIVKEMYYLSKSRKNAIELANILEETLGNDPRYAETIEYIRKNGFRVEPEIISKKSGEGVKLSESVNLNLQDESKQLVDKIKRLSFTELNEIITNGGLDDTQNIISSTFANSQENEK